MSDSILAGETHDLQQDPETFEFVPKREGLTGPVFTVQTLDWFAYQDYIGQPTPVEQIRRAVELGLTAVDGDADRAKAFLARPKLRYVNPLFRAIREIALGN